MAPSERGPSEIVVIMPAWNRANVIERSIRSVLDQDFEQFELVVVDDGSTDGTVEVVRAMAATDARLRLVEQDHLGVSGARNRGVAESTAPFLTFLDSDDEARPGWLSTMAAGVRDVDLFSCAAEFISPDGSRAVKTPSALGPAFGNVTAQYLAGTYAIRRGVFERIGGFRVGLRFGENSDIGFRLAEYADDHELKVAHTALPLVEVTSRADRYDAAVQYESAITALSTASPRLELDRTLLGDYLAIGGVAASRLGKRRESLRLLGRAILADKRNPRHVARFLRAVLTRRPTSITREANS